MPKLLNAGDWRPGSANMALLIVQIINLWQAWLRGRAYLNLPPPPTSGPGSGLSVAESTVPGGLHTWGLLLMASALLVIVGLASHRAVPIIVGHCLLAGWYVGLGRTVLVAVGVDIDFATIAGLIVSAIATWIMFRPDHDPEGPPVARRWWAPWRHVPPLSSGVRILVGAPGLIIGQELLVGGLADSYQNGTGLIAAGAVHLTLAVGTWVMWNRQRIRARVVQQVIREGHV